VFGSQEVYAQKLRDEYTKANIPPTHVLAQSFNYADGLYWIRNEPKFGTQAVFLDDANVPSDLPTLADLQKYKADGVNIWAPPMWALLTVSNGQIVPSQSALNAKAANLDIITWTIERSGRIVQEVLPTKSTASPSFYYRTTLDALHNDGDILITLDVLAWQVGIRGIFSNWSATV
jgi:glycerophosphoryl diester phosphodiesterase